MKTDFIERIWWLSPELLGGMPVPSSSDLETIAGIGVKAVVNLLEERPDPLDYESSNLELFWLPIRDMAPPSVEQVDDFTAFVNSKMQIRHPVLVHCFSGQGRTGTVLAGWLIHQGYTAIDAIKAVREVQPRAIEDRSQESFLLELESFLKNMS